MNGPAGLAELKTILSKHSAVEKKDKDINKFLLRFLLLFISFLNITCQNNTDLISESDLFSERTRLSKRSEFKSRLIHHTIEFALSKNLSDSTESDWQGAFWAMGLARYRSQKTDVAMNQALADFDNRSDSFKRSLLEILYTLYEDEYITDIINISMRTTSNKLFAMCAIYLKGYDNDLIARMVAKFPDWQSDPILYSLYQDLSGNVYERPPLADLLRHDFSTKSPVVFSIQRPDRRYPGLLLIRLANGQFLKTENDSMFYIRQLALSSSNLPGYLANGNTPQGVFSMQGELISQNVFIGPTPTLQTVMPFEVSVSEFFHSTDTKGQEWEISRYSDLLPDSWKEYTPIYEAYYAGQAGRTEIIAHGSTIDPEFYRNEPFYPLTPSLGCMTAYERWNDQTGVCEQSRQLQLVNRLKKSGDLNGFLIVVEINDIKKPVSMADLSIIAANKKMQK